MAYMIVPAKFLSLICHSMPAPLPHLISMQQPCTGYHKWASDQWAHDQGWPSSAFFNMSWSFLPPHLWSGCSLNSESPSPSPYENPTQSSKDWLKGLHIHCQRLPRWLSNKESCLPSRRYGFSSLVGKIAWRRKWHSLQYSWDSLVAQMVKCLYSCLETPMDRGAWQATLHGITEELDMT